jgi:pimeloyl-ACP methyl ester carboxylesterase
MVVVMERLGSPRFSVAGHDRGGRVAYRMALDHPERVERLAVLDVLPTATVWDRADARVALNYWPNRKAEAEITQLAAKLNRLQDRLEDIETALARR